jgi:hypothetical protein
MPNVVREINKEKERQDKDAIFSLKIHTDDIRSNVKTEDGLFSDDNRWEFDLSPDLLQKLGVDVDSEVTIQMFKISGVPIVNIDVLESSSEDIEGFELKQESIENDIKELVGKVSSSLPIPETVILSVLNWLGRHPVVLNQLMDIAQNFEDKNNE